MSRLIDADVLVETLADQIKANESDTSASGMVAKEALKGFIGLVNGQPTAQPEVATDTNVPSTDCISRQAAIDAMNTRLEDIKLTWRGKVKKGEIAMYLDMRGVIETLPSAQPERMKGAWINEGRIIRCNKCKIGYAAVKGMKSALTYNFCPNCGVDMRGEQDG